MWLGIMVWCIGNMVVCCDARCECGRGIPSDVGLTPYLTWWCDAVLWLWCGSMCEM